MKDYKYYIQKIEHPSEDLLIIQLADIGGRPVFDFKPGQYVMIYYENDKGRLEQKHTFSIASSPLEKRYIRLGIRVGGKFTQGLKKMKAGKAIYLQGPFGSFVYDEKKYSDLVFIAGGIGITPFISALNYAGDKNFDNKLTLVYSARTLDNAVFFDEILELEKNHKNIRALFSITNEKILPKAGNVIASRIDSGIIINFIGSVQGKTFFVCGPPIFMEAMEKNLYLLGTQKSQIKTEGFSMTGSGFWPNLKHISYATGFSAAVLLTSFYLVNSTVTGNTASSKSYDSSLLNQLNKAVIDRLSEIAGAKQTAILSLEQARQQAASSTVNSEVIQAVKATSGQNNTAKKASPADPKTPAKTNTQITTISSPVSVPQSAASQPALKTPAPITQPTTPTIQMPTPQPMPRTGVS